ncbi:hypothetical protein C0Q70_20987 [Pomacea canaliculata]|uniref:Sacsin/Nov domain-containing protein n=1 Tax=Pomacea canaliculata TaxID=400727 RepID=A0A2T7NB90_POMCA|nr:hypothetical protein C0Q70_20987 [Pomacea canaliculata]
MEQPVLPVHLNGTFALTSSRRNLLISTEENIDNKGGNWNSALVSDAVCRAYVLLLESLKDNVDVNYSSYYELWPRSENGLSLVDSFYSCLINSNCSVFPSQIRWVSFDEATFFDPVFRLSQVGDLAFTTVLELKKDQIIMVSDFWKTPDKVRMRDTLTLHAIVRGSDHVRRLLSTVACIPCDVSHELKTPDELVHPFCDAAALFLPADGRFPQKGNEGAVDFCQSECLMRLTELGMNDDDLQWKDVIHRAISVKELLTLDKNLAFSRAINIVDYLALISSSSKTLRIFQYSPDETEQLSRTEFLPVLTKPCDWPFPWFEDDLQPRLAAPCELYHSRMMNLVACTQKLLDDSSTSSLRRKATKESRRTVHDSLKIVTQELPTHEDTVKSAVNQLLIVARFHESHQEIQRPHNSSALLVRKRKTPIFGPKQVSLPDQKGFLRCVSNLCLDDSSSLRLKPGMHFIHGKFSPEVAKTLGVKSKNSTIFKSHMKVKRFGQSEKLTNRIKRLLQGYTCDVSIFKEFIQNADDAGATEIRFIKDFRQLGTDSVPDGWKDLQGPALCVYNNADFTSKDIAGIQNLGEGSKGEEMMKTGQFGVGFNAVYHITDVPSFWTRRDGTEQVICVCDPCVLIPNEWQEPGMELEDIDSLKEEYPDLVDGYLLNTFDMSQPATLFRLPLRTKLMAAKSEIKKEQMTEYTVSLLLTNFLKDASLCLLFLNNVQKIGIYSTEDGRKLEKEYEVEMVIDRSNALRKAAFREILSGESEMMIDDDLSSGIVEMKSSETIVNFSLKDSHGVQEDWIQVSRAGFLDASKAPEKLQDDWRKEHFRLLPRGGVAVKIKTTQPAAADTLIYQYGVSKPLSKQDNVQSGVFCTLPLPVKTHLPVHINGHFALEHESRRNLWDREDDSRTMWNKLLCTDIIAPSYVKALEQVRFAWFRQKQYEDETSTEAAAKVPQFFALFPSIPKTESSFWSPLVEAFYQQVINGRQALFPVTRADTASVTWTSIIKDKGFAGYFTRPPGYSPPESPCYSPIDDEEMVSDGKLAELLKRLNMKIVQAPLHVFNALKYYGAHKIQEATVSAVLIFLKSCTATGSDTCQLNNLPQPLADLGLDEKDVLTLATFVEKSPHFSSNIVGLPLCLLQSGILDVFSVDREDDARTMLYYFSYHPTQISQFGNSYYLREIPMFCAIGGQVTSLDSQNAVLLLPEEIPQDGLEVWAKETETVLLDPSLIPDEVCKMVHLNKSTNLHMIFWRRLLPDLEYLPNDCVHTHILYIRENYRVVCSKPKTRKNLCEILSETAFIRLEPDGMCKASEFYSPYNVVFREMLDVDKFPPAPYCDGEWREFMEKVGMVKEVTVKMFISFARQVAAEGADALSEKTLTRSSTLVQHLFARSDLLNYWLLDSICDISFVRPWSFKQTETHKGLEKICPPFVVNRLVSFSESCRSSNWQLLWSSTPILHPDDEPNTFDLDDLKEVLEQLNFEQNIPEEYFKQHVENVCHALHTATCDILNTSEGRREVEWLFDEIYEFLATFEPEEMDFFKNIPVVFDSYNRRMLYPEQVVFGLKSDQAVEGWLFRSTNEL